MVNLQNKKPWYAGEIFYGHGSPGIYQFEGVHSLSGVPNAVASKYRYNPVPTNENTDWSNWGEDNMFPSNVDEDVRKNGIATRALEILIQAHFGKGFYTYKDEITEDAKLVKKIVKDQQFQDFAKLTNLNRFFIQIINDYVWFRNPFVELIFSKDAKKIALVKRHDPIHCRWHVCDEKGNIPYLFVSADWPNPGKDKYTKIPALDVNYPLLDLLNRRELGKIKPGDSVIMPLRINNGGNIYYDKTPWDAIRTQYLPVATNIPKMVKALQENEMYIKYMIKVPYSYWEHKYGTEWNGWTKEVQNAKIKEWREKFDQFLRGYAQAGKSFVTFYDRDPITGKIYDEILIEAISEKSDGKKWIIDSSAANSENLFALGVDPTIMGQSSPGGSEGGSGSNKREAFAILQALMGVGRTLLFQPLELIRDFNGWDPDLQFGHVDIDTSQTLDKNPTGKQTTLS